jgi:hypothetical protein
MLTWRSSAFSVKSVNRSVSDAPDYGLKATSPTQEIPVKRHFGIRACAVVGMFNSAPLSAMNSVTLTRPIMPSAATEPHRQRIDLRWCSHAH